MFGIVKFAITALFAGIVISIISIAWPKFTGHERPVPLQYVQGVVGTTQFGQGVSSVLGISDTDEVIDIASVTGDLKTWASSAAEQAVRSFIASRLVHQIILQYNQFPEQQKKELREFICKP